MADYQTENFGILTDDDLYLDCVLFRPEQISDEQMRSIRVWVPKFPLSKTSILTCARSETRASGLQNAAAHLVFDLRGTGESEGLPGDTNFDMDLLAIKAWAHERFGRINVTFLGQPIGQGQPGLFPLGPAVTIEYYLYGSRHEYLAESTKPPLIYLATLGQFSERDDALCQNLADLGYKVYGLDPLRYLLHASATRRLLPLDLWNHFRQFCTSFHTNPVLLAQPVSAGLGLMWTSGIEEIRGVIAVGRAQIAFSSNQIFHNDDVRTYALSRQLYNISPRPLTIVRLKDHPLGGAHDELALLYDASDEPHRYEQVSEISTAYLQTLLDWTVTVI